ncbi:hypothetical protein N5853_03415 [Bartonella sp. HY329]|uniref:hypothetical protein n=1 Tax=unclassified Bartonella TaxID=2645622 RepID=UPI0021C653C0|nr:MULTISPECIES: hypothetical protein [unclassified Bartonella]UXM95689.1 hypothetical protein N5853_03415 [Bartonella sp. HY329]UXN10014.1 hypothetical protein N5852_03425 [Bartonella sp. HY328]
MPSVFVHDLHYWEQIIIESYRIWRKAQPTTAIIEHRLAANLRWERIYPFINALFELFRRADKINEIKAGQEGDYLTPTELLLIDLVASTTATAPYHGDLTSKAAFIEVEHQATQMLKLFAQVGIIIRPSLSITPSEEEQLARLTANSYQHVFRME